MLALTTIALFVGYAMYSSTRKVLGTCTPAIRAALLLSKTDIGSINSSFSLAYGFSKFCGGIVSDVVSCRALFAAGLALAGFSNILFGVSSGLGTLIACWFANGIVQGMGWPALAKIVMLNYPKSRIGSVWSIMTTAGNVGYMASPFLFLQLLSVGTWRQAFAVSGWGAVALAVLVYLMLPRDQSTQDVSAKEHQSDHTNGTASALNTADSGDKGLKANGSGDVAASTVVTQAKSTVTAQKSQSDTRNNTDASVQTTLLGGLSSWASLVHTHLLFNLSFWLLLLADACVYFALKGFVDWTLLYLVEERRMSEFQSTQLLFWSEIGGIAGTFASGFMSDMIHAFTGKPSRTLTCLIFVLLCAASCAALLYVDPLVEYHKALLCIFLVGVFVNGPKTLCGIAVRENTPAKVSGTAAGLLGLVGQVGASFAGAPLGRFLEENGMHSLPAVLAASCVSSGALLLLPCWLDWKVSPVKLTKLD